MKLPILLLSILAVISFSCKGNKKGTDQKLDAENQSQTVSVSDTITNIKTNKYTNIPGTKMFVVLPEGFKETVPGTYINSNEAGLVINQLDGGSFYTNAKDMSRGTYEQMGMNVLDYKEFSLNGYPAKYVHCQTDYSQAAYNLAFGDSTFSVLLMGMHPLSDEVSGKKIRDAILSSVYDENYKVNYEDATRFTMDNSKSRFKMFAYTGGSFMYSIDGNKNVKLGKDSQITIAQLSATDISLSDISAMMNSFLQKYGLSEVTPVSESKAVINGTEAIEQVLQAKVQGNATQVYILCQQKNDKAIIFTGLASSNMDASIAEFRKLAHSIKFK